MICKEVNESWLTPILHEPQLFTPLAITQGFEAWLFPVTTEPVTVRNLL
jgi:hypothetical protein